MERSIHQQDMSEDHEIGKLHDVLELSETSGTSAISQPVEPDSVDQLVAKPFRFLDLPRELRDLICKELVQVKLTSNESRAKGHGDWKQRSMYGDHRRGYPHLQILRLSRKVHAEARYVFLQENLFIRFVTTMSLAEIEQLFKGMQFCAQGEKSLNFKGVVADCSAINTDIQETGIQRLLDGRPVNVPIFQCIIPFSQLPLLCRHILRVARETPNYHKKFHHAVTLQDPYANSTEGGSTDSLVPRSFYSTKVQKKLLTEFRCAFKELFPKFEVHGNVSGALRDATIADITVVRHRNPMKVLASLDSIKERSKKLYREKHYKQGRSAYRELEFEIKKMHETFIGDEVAKVGGLNFRNELAKMRFENLLRNVKYLIKAMQEEIETLDAFDRATSATLEDSITTTWKYSHRLADNVNGSTWFPPIQQGSKLAFLSAVGYRLKGQAKDNEAHEKMLLGIAERYIVKAQGLAAGDLAIEAEYELIAAWKLKVEERISRQ